MSIAISHDWIIPYPPEVALPLFTASVARTRACNRVASDMERVSNCCDVIEVTTHQLAIVAYGRNLYA